jgi:hypothetical protein
LKGLEHLRNIHFMMDKNEHTVLRNYLNSFESRKKGHKPKSVMLLDLLEKYEDDDKVLGLLKKKVPSEDARRMVISRLRDKMLTSLTLDVNMSREENYDAQARARATVVQGKIQGTLLLGRGQRKLGYQILDKWIQQAKHFEFYDDLVDMLCTQRQVIKAFKGTDEAFYAIDKQIYNYSKSRDAANLAKKYFEEITMKYGFKGLSRVPTESGQLLFLKERIGHLEKAFDETSSATVGYYYYFLLIEYNQLQNKLEAASGALDNLVQMLENNPAIRRKVRLASVNANMGVNELWLHRFEGAGLLFETSLTHLRPNTRNHALIMELLFYSQFYSGEFEEAKASLLSLVENKHADQSEFRKAVRNYLLACCAFATGDFKQVNLFLLDSQSIGQDKEGWNIGSRILSVMLSIEQGKFDYADSLVVNLRQFMREGLKGLIVRERDKIIVQLLVELRKLSYNFHEVQQSKEDLINQLRIDDPETGWVLQTPEMISFHTWFDDKMKERGYSANYRKDYLYMPFTAEG